MSVNDTRSRWCRREGIGRVCSSPTEHGEARRSQGGCATFREGKALPRDRQRTHATLAPMKLPAPRRRHGRSMIDVFTGVTQRSDPNIAHSLLNDPDLVQRGCSGLGALAAAPAPAARRAAAFSKTLVCSPPRSSCNERRATSPSRRLVLATSPVNSLCMEEAEHALDLSSRFVVLCCHVRQVFACRFFACIFSTPRQARRTLHGTCSGLRPANPCKRASETPNGNTHGSPPAFRYHPHKADSQRTQHVSKPILSLRHRDHFKCISLRMEGRARMSLPPAA